MEQAQQNAFSENDLQQLLRSEAGIALLALLRRDGGAALREAAACYRAGRPDAAWAVLSPLLASEEAAALLGRLEQERGHGR